MTLKPTSKDGVILYNGHRTDGVGDFMAISIHGGHFEFTFDLGTGAASVRYVNIFFKIFFREEKEENCGKFLSQNRKTGHDGRMARITTFENWKICNITSR